MKTIRAFLIVACAWGANAFAGDRCSTLMGGMIGGGEVSFKPLLICDATGIDPTFPGSSRVQVIKEVGYGGQVIPEATLRVLTLDGSGQPVRYYVTDRTDLPAQQSAAAVEVPLWRYEVGSKGNRRIGAFTWSPATGTGRMIATGTEIEVEELVLSNCRPQ